MLQAVKEADVVVTNPTRLAVVLRYDRAKTRAPKVVAKGARLMAKRIRDLAREHGVPYAVVRRGKPFDVHDFSVRVTAQLNEWQPGLIVFGGFLSMYLPPQCYTGRVINIHPALLPAFGGQGMYGDRVHEAVLASGARVTGCTVHMVDATYDTGPIVAQRTVPVLDGDTPETLGARVRATERELYPEVIGWFAAGRVQLGEDGKVRISDRDLRMG